MEYTIKNLVKLSGVSVRTLHYYDEIGLLVPSIRMSNGRRYYGKKEVMCLMHILSLKELGFSLQKIQDILSGSAADNIRALMVQKEIISKELTYLKYSMHMLDARVSHYKGEYHMDMSDADIQNSFEYFKYKQEYVKHFDENYLKEKQKNLERTYREQLGEEACTQLRHKILVFNPGCY